MAPQEKTQDVTKETFKDEPKRPLKDATIWDVALGIILISLTLVGSFAGGYAYSDKKWQAVQTDWEDMVEQRNESMSRQGKLAREIDQLRLKERDWKTDGQEMYKYIKAMDRFTLEHPELADELPKHNFRIATPEEESELDPTERAKRLPSVMVPSKPQELPWMQGPEKGDTEWPRLPNSSPEKPRPENMPRENTPFGNSSPQGGTLG